MRKALQQARICRDLYQKNVAEYLGMATKAYQRIESGARGTSEKNWIKLFELFNRTVPIDKLMENTPKESGCPTLARQSSQKENNDKKVYPH